MGYVNAHATSTPMGDDIEAAALTTLFRENSGGSDGSSSSPQPLAWVSSTKGATGHLLGAAGALEAALTVLALHTGRVPNTRNLDDPTAPQAPSPQGAQGDGECGAGGAGWAHVPAAGGAAFAVLPTLSTALSNSFGFGGTNTSILFGKY